MKEFLPGTTLAKVQVEDSMFVAVGRLLGKASRASVEVRGGEYVIGYREGRDVCVIARDAAWERALAVSTSRVELVDRLVRDTPSNNVAIATAASVPVRFVRIRRRDLGVA